MDCSPPGSSVHGIFQARALEWVPLPSPRAGTTGSESETERKPEVPASTRDEALFHCTTPSGVPRGPYQLHSIPEFSEAQKEPKRRGSLRFLPPLEVRPSSVWREDPGVLSRSCRKRRPSAREDGGVSLDGKPTMSCANNPSVLRFLGSKGVLYQPHSLLRK